MMRDAYSSIDPPSEREAKEIVFRDVTTEHPTFDAAHLRIVIDTGFDRFGALGSMAGWLAFSRAKLGANVIKNMEP
eukprot:2783885-Pyramimonas_sp.AAC.2